MPDAPLSVRLVLGGTLAFAGFLFCLISIPLVRGFIPMNRFYGVRIPKAFESDAAWYAVNRFGGRLFILYGLGVMAVGALLCVLPLAPDRWYFWPLMLTPVWLFVPVIWRIVAYAKRLP